MVSSVHPDNCRVVLETGEVVTYEKLLIATGARARLFPGMEGCLTLRSDRDAKAILTLLRPGARIGIVGGGFIGLELAATARGRGADVTVIEAGSRLLARAVPEQVTDVVTARHKAEGVLIDCGVKVERADGRHIVINGGPSSASIPLLWVWVRSRIRSLLKMPGLLSRTASLWIEPSARLIQISLLLVIAAVLNGADRGSG